MLTNTRLSRARRTTGAAALIGAIAGGLIVTASGTQAAAALSAKVESATGVQIAAPPAPPTPPAAPAVAVTAPAAPAVPATRPAPPAPPTPVTRTRRADHVVIVKDGKTTRYDGDAAAAYVAAHPVPLTPAPPFPPVPTVVSSDDCQPATGTPTVTRPGDRGQKIIIVCRNRIRQTAALAAQQAEWGRRQAEAAARQSFQAERRAEVAKRNGLQQAVASIRLARHSIQNERNLTDDQRRDALAGLDDAMREISEQMRP